MEEILSNRQSDLVIGVYTALLNQHKEYCGCDYCVLHRKYVKEKLQYHRTRQFVESEDYPYYHTRSLMTDLHYLGDMKHKLSLMRSECKQMKKLGGG